MLLSIACPRCQHPLQVPKPTPDYLRCDKCGTNIKNMARQPKPTPVASAMSTMDKSPSTMDQPRSSAAPVAPSAAIAKGAPAVPVASSAAVRAGVPVAAFAAGSQVGSTLAGPDVSRKSNARRNGAIAAGFVLVVGLCLWLLLRSRPEADVALNIPKDNAPAPKAIDPRVKKSVDSGVAYLKRYVQALNPPKTPIPRMGEIGLVGVTLLECGVPADDPDVEKLTDIMRKAVPQIITTYDAAPVIFFLDRLHQGKTMPEDDRKRIQTLALRLVKGQNRPLNLWTYGIPVLPAKEEDVLLGKLREKSDKYDTTTGGADLSNSQFAALALWSSRKSGVPVDVALSNAANTMRKYQDAKSGTWSYSVTPGPYKDTGTCVGLIMLALGRAVSDAKETKEFLEDPAVEKGLQHLGRVVNRHVDNYEKTKPAKRALIGADAHGDLYFLWTLERTCLILGLKSLGDHDWHRWGTEILLDHQLPDGSWSNGNGPGPDTCFALLFLMQANLFQDLTDKLRLGMSAAPPAPQLGSQPANKQ